ncbi:MAG: host-nuclease inhibitor Gam family protein [Desulfovibrio sp.]|jgi:phage host-nuclease inhibitor protein Gam|nr:host-nuclease inhibitor Gam family protein [Desulfovibrio sp.]
MSKRVKPAVGVVPAIHTLDEADTLLAEIAGLKRSISLITLGAEERIEAVKKGVAQECDPIREEIAAREEALARFAEYHKGELFTRRKSAQLTFGILGFRASSKLKTLHKWTWERVLGALREAGKRSCLRIKEEVDKEALKTLPPEQLAEFGVRLVTEDSFFYELDEALVAPETGGEA